MDKEVRVVSTEFELRAAEGALEGDRKTIYGYAAVFNSNSELMLDAQRGPYTERITPGAFSWSDVLALREHDTTRLLARYREGRENNTLTLTQNERGLRYSFTPPNTTDGNDLTELIRLGDIDSSSFAFVVEPNGDTWSMKGKRLFRQINKAIVYDVSPVAEPAFTKTTVSTRSYDKWVSENQQTSKQMHINRMRQTLAGIRK